MAIKADYKDAADRPLHPPERSRTGRWVFLILLGTIIPLALFLGSRHEQSAGNRSAPVQPTPDSGAQPKPALDKPEEPDPGALAPVMVRQATRQAPAAPLSPKDSASVERSNSSPTDGAQDTDGGMGAAPGKVHADKAAQATAVKAADDGASTRSSTPNPAPEETGPQPRRYDFYRILRDYEVEVPEPPRAIATPRPASASDSTPDPRALAEEKRRAERPSEGIYTLQTGSFRTREQAETLRAELALLGLEAAISDTRADDGRTWFRVRVGPYRDADERNAVIENLEGNGIKPILVRMK
ncbi:MAG: SPOR domain-containing protein [Gammaproteobacteria bacterium]